LCTAAGWCGSECALCEKPWQCDTIDFSSGTLADWSFNTPIVVTSLGTTVAPTGGHMLMLGTDQTKVYGPALASFQNCLQAGEYQIAIDWRFYSEEFKEWCGSVFQDTMHIWAEMEDGSAVEVAEYDVDDLCPPEECAWCGSFYQGLIQSDVIFDQGGVWNTPWLESTALVTVPANDAVVTLHVELSDMGDSIYNSALLIDRIVFK